MTAADKVLSIGSCDFFAAFAVGLSGRHVVDASAGTGKTHAITSLVTRLLVERRFRIKDVLVVTFTEAATAELRERVRHRLREAFDVFSAISTGSPADQTDLGIFANGRKASAAEDRQWLALALEEVDEAPISTIHGFCHRVLEEAALSSGVPFDADLIADVRPLRDDAIDDFHSQDLASQPIADVRAILASETDLRRMWQGLADKLLRNPDAMLLPARADDRARAWTDVRRRLRSVWVRADVERLLSLKRPGFKPPQARHLSNWCDQIESLLDAAEAPREVPTAFKHLTTRALASKHPGGPHHGAFEVLDEMHSLIAADAGPTALVAAKQRFAIFLRAELQRRKQALGAITFDDLLLHLRQALRGPAAPSVIGAVRHRFKAALIDEFQDTDPVQFEIFETLFRGGDAPLFLIGDPKQAIYGFRGADVNAYIQAVQAPATAHHSMGVNWRSDPGLIGAINALFQPRPSLPHPFILPGIEFTPVQARLGAADVFASSSGVATAPIEVIVTGDDERAERAGTETGVAPSVAAEISRLLAGPSTIAGRPVVPADVAVLTRTNQQAVAIQQALRALQIPAVLLGDKSVLDSVDAHELLIVLRAVAEPTHASLLRNALATGLVGVPAHDLVGLETDAAGSARWSDLFRALHDLWLAQGFVPMFRAWLANEHVQPRLLTFIDGERRVTNLLHLMELIHRAARDGHLGPSGVVHWLAQAPSNAEGGVAPEEAQIRLESDEAAVKLTTVHRSKGLEYPIVFCPHVAHETLLFANDKKVVRFHDPNAGMTLDLGSTALAAHQEQARQEALAENVRLLYVALTRAKHRCVLLWPGHRAVKEAALASLLYPLAQRKAGEDLLLGSLKDLSDVDLLSPFEAWSARCGGQVAVRHAGGLAPALPYAQAPGPRPVGPPRQVERPVSDWLRTTSFSTMTARAPHTAGRDLVVIDPESSADRDAALASAESGRDAGTLGNGTSVRAGNDDAPFVLKSEDAIPLALFPRGAKAGNFFHGLLETADFAADPASLTPAVRDQLQLYRYPEQPWSEVVPVAIRDVVSTPLHDGRSSFCLRDVPDSRRVSEFEFALPMGGGVATAPLQLGLARAFDVGARSPAEQRYGARVATLPIGAITGFLRGFVDLVFEHDGRYFLVDYKTNHLGPAWNDYRSQRLEAAMEDGHYHLQAHLYALALTRHLARTRPGFDAEVHWGGVFYLFLRGMGGASRPMSGVYFARPPVARLLALDALFPGSEGRA